jgi:cytochrome c
MKKLFPALFFLSLLAACGGSGEKKEPKVVDITQDPNYQKGLQLEAVNDCKTCHAIDTRITGPSFREIADKYADAPDTIVSHLANKVMSGGTGVWGEIPMLAHPSLKKEDAEAIVKYILLLKTKKP